MIIITVKKGILRFCKILRLFSFAEGQFYKKMLQELISRIVTKTRKIREPVKNLFPHKVLV